MSLKGKVKDRKLLGKVSSLKCIHGYSAYELAVINGFVGTEEEWLDSLMDEAKEEIYAELKEEFKVYIQENSGRISYIDLLSANWQGDKSPYSQVVTIDGVTENSKVDINPSIEQLAIFHEKDIAFVAENEDGVVTVYCVGQKPTADYQMQITITEVLVNG